MREIKREREGEKERNKEGEKQEEREGARVGVVGILPRASVDHIAQPSPSIC